MRASRHTSVAAHRTYQVVGNNADAAQIAALGMDFVSLQLGEN